MMTFDIKYQKNVDISDFDYEELNTLEDKIKKRKIELERTQYESLVNNVLSAINAIIEEGYGYRDACYDDEGEPYDWKNLSYIIAQEYRRKKEDY